MNTYERSLDIVVTRIMKEDARGRREPDPRSLRALRRLVNMSPTNVTAYGRAVAYDQSSVGQTISPRRCASTSS